MLKAALIGFVVLYAGTMILFRFVHNKRMLEIEERDIGNEQMR